MLSDLRIVTWRMADLGSTEANVEAVLGPAPPVLGTASRHLIEGGDATRYETAVRQLGCSCILINPDR